MTRPDGARRNRVTVPPTVRRDVLPRILSHIVGRRLLVTVSVTVAALASSGTPSAVEAAPAPMTFAMAGNNALSTLLGVFYAGGGRWRACDAPDCQVGNGDWGYDSLTYALALRFEATHGVRLLGILRALASTATDYPAPCASPSPCAWSSDVPAWDAVALTRIYLATRDPRTLAKAKAAFTFVERSAAYALGSCPRISYQFPAGGTNSLKTLETDSNAIKAALLLYRATRDRAYLVSARERYESARAYFLDPAVPLYTVYVFDDGQACRQLPRRFFASANGNMIWSGLELFRDTGQRRYRDEAVATARAVDRRLSDGRGIFADLQAENDVVEPLVEAMDALAREVGSPFARRWVLRNAAAALAARNGRGSFGRFFDGPPPLSTVTAWQVNGAVAVEIAAAALAPRETVRSASAWSAARAVPRDPVGAGDVIAFRGSGVALLGTLGEVCCESGHARVLLDGRETFNHTGIWQNKSSSGRSIDGTVLFAWRWRTSGRHTISFAPGIENGKEGGAFLHIRGYLVVG